MLADDSLRKPWILRFFRDFFDHDLGGYIYGTAQLERLGSPQGDVPLSAMFDASTDRLIELILQEDKDVSKSSDTRKVVATGNDSTCW